MGGWYAIGRNAPLDMNNWTINWWKRWEAQRKLRPTSAQNSNKRWCWDKSPVSFVSIVGYERIAQSLSFYVKRTKRMSLHWTICVESYKKQNFNSRFFGAAAESLADASKSAKLCKMYKCCWTQVSESRKKTTKDIEIMIHLDASFWRQEGQSSHQIDSRRTLKKKHWNCAKCFTSWRKKVREPYHFVMRFKRKTYETMQLQRWHKRAAESRCGLFSAERASMKSISRVHPTHHSRLSRKQFNTRTILDAIITGIDD